MADYRFTTGDVEESLSVMREAAGWLINMGKMLWHPEELTRERLTNAAEEFIVLWRCDESAGTMLLCFNDPLIWPEIPPGVSGFVHKLSVRRKYALDNARHFSESIPVSERLMTYAVEKCRERGISELRLDCDAGRPKLCAVYERMGFVLEKVQQIQTKRLGTVDLAYYKLDIPFHGGL